VITVRYTEMPRYTLPVPTLLEDHKEQACYEAANNRLFVVYVISSRAGVTLAMPNLDTGSGCEPGKKL
jgi:hypothetical protein